MLLPDPKSDLEIIAVINLVFVMPNMTLYLLPSYVSLNLFYRFFNFIILSNYRGTQCNLTLSFSVVLEIYLCFEA